MTKTKQGDTVKVHFTGKLENGKIFDTSLDKEPLEFTIGKGQIIKGFEEAIIGMGPGESKTANIPKEKAYGSVQDHLMVEVPRDKIPEQIEPKVGEQLEVQQTDGRRMPVTIAFVSDDNVTLDANHPLAGQDLIFDIELLEIVE